MIERYTLPEMGRVWSEAHKYELWCRVETIVLEAHAAAGTVPADAVDPVRDAPPPTPEAVAAVETVTRVEGILPALETAHAFAVLPRLLAGVGDDGRPLDDPPAWPRDAVVLLGLSGRGDKDLATIERWTAARADATASR